MFLWRNVRKLFPGKVIDVNAYSMLNMSLCSRRIYYSSWVNSVLSEFVPAPELPGVGSMAGGCQVVCWLDYEQALLSGQFPGNLCMPSPLQPQTQKWFLECYILLITWNDH